MSAFCAIQIVSAALNAGFGLHSAMTGDAIMAAINGGAFVFCALLAVVQAAAEGRS